MTRKEVIEKIIEFFKDNDDVFSECIEELDDYNGYLGDNRYYDMDMLPEFVSTDDVFRLLNMAYFGDDLDNWHLTEDGEKRYDSFNPNREYFSFNGYGNLVSSNWKDYSSFNDEYVVESMEENRRYIDSIDDNSELCELFDMLEECEE